MHWVTSCLGKGNWSPSSIQKYFLFRFLTPSVVYTYKTAREKKIIIENWRASDPGLSWFTVHACINIYLKEMKCCYYWAQKKKKKILKHMFSPNYFVRWWYCFVWCVNSAIGCKIMKSSSNSFAFNLEVHSWGRGLSSPSYSAQLVRLN